MPLQRIFVSEDLDDALFEIYWEFPNLTIHTDLDLPRFFNLHKKTLFNLEDSVGLVVPTGLKYDDLLPALESKIDIDVIWIFDKLPKNGKLYKHLSKNYQVTFCSKLSKDQDKKAFISDLAKKLGVKRKLISEFIKKSGMNKRVIYQELVKLRAAQDVIPDPLEVVIDDSDGLECFKFIDALFDKDEQQAIKLLSKLEKYEPGYKVAAILAKKVMCLMLVCVGDTNQANKYFRLPNHNYFRNKIINQSKSAGLATLSSIHTKLQKEIITFSSKKPYFVLRQIVWDFCQNNV